MSNDITIIFISTKMKHTKDIVYAVTELYVSINSTSYNVDIQSHC